MGDLELIQIDGLKIFDPLKQLKDIKNFFMIITSRGRTGKSVLMKDFLYQIKDFYKECYVFSSTAYLEPHIFNFVNKDRIFEEINDYKIDEILDSQKIKINNFPDVNPYIILIFDSVNFHNPKNYEILSKLSIVARHHMIACIVISQSYKIVPNCLKINSDVNILINRKLTLKDKYKAIINVSMCPTDLFTYIAKQKIPHFKI